MSLSLTAAPSTLARPSESAEAPTATEPVAVSAIESIHDAGAADRARLLPPGSAERPDLSIVILSYQVRELLLACLDSVLASRGAFSYEVVVVDNRSTDGSAAAVRDRFPDVAVIAAPRNGGYAWGNNLGLRRARGRYLLLLNPDTTVSPAALATLLAYADARPSVGVVGPKLVRPDGRLDLACRRSFPTPEVAFYQAIKLARLFPHSRRFGRYNMTYLDPDRETEVDAVAGACMLVRAEAARQAGLLDERYFMYGEDIDWAYRIKSAGWRVRYVPSAVVAHHKGASSRRAWTRANAAFYRAMLIFHRTHFWRRTPAPLNAAIVVAVYLHWGLSRLLGALGGPAARRVGSS